MHTHWFWYEYEVNKPNRKTHKDNAKNKKIKVYVQEKKINTLGKNT